MTEVTVDIHRDPRAPTQARRAVEDLPLDPEVVPDLQLLISELVTNSVKYGASDQVALVLRTEHPRHVHAQVLDQGRGFVPIVRDRPLTDVGGWGLYLVEELTQTWGVLEGSTHVWFEIDRR